LTVPTPANARYVHRQFILAARISPNEVCGACDNEVSVLGAGPRGHPVNAMIRTLADISGIMVPVCGPTPKAPSFASTPTTSWLRVTIATSWIRRTR
jgi:hypothetical protein